MRRLCRQDSERDFGELFRCMAEVEGDEMEEVALQIQV